MATSTTKLGLTKPDYTDVVDVADLNDNADKLDAAAGFTIVANAAARPATPWTGQVIYQVDVTSSFMWDGYAWQPAGGGGGSIEISSTAPASPSAGDLWWDSDNGNLYIYYDDGDSQQWVAANGPQVFVGTSAPDGYQGQLWFDSTEGKVYIYYDDGTSAQWVSAIGGDSQLDITSPVAGQSLVYNGTKFENAYSGLTHLHTETLTSSSTVSINNIFTSNYSNYRIVISGVGSASANFFFRMRASGSDYTSSLYYGNIIYTTNSAGPTRVYNASAAQGVLGEVRDLAVSSSMDVYGPNLAFRTSLSTTAQAAGSSDNIGVNHWYFVNTLTQFDGITIYPSTGTFTGTIRIYGYSDS
jgi:hypothetical protein